MRIFAPSLFFLAAFQITADCLASDAAEPIQAPPVQNQEVLFEEKLECAGPFGPSSRLPVISPGRAGRSKWVIKNSTDQVCVEIPKGRVFTKLRCRVFVPGGTAYQAFCEVGAGCGYGAVFARLAMTGDMSTNRKICATVHGAKIGSSFSLYADLKDSEQAQGTH